MNRIILHPTDFSECAAVAFNSALVLAEKLGCELLIVHSIDSSQLGEYDQSGRTMLSRSDQLEKEAHERLQNLGQTAIERNTKCRAHLYNGKLTTWISNIIKDENPFLIVMGTTGAGSVTNKLFGSNTNAVIQSSSSPVLTIPLNFKSENFSDILLAADLNNVNKVALKYLSELVTLLNGALSLLYVVAENKVDDGSQAIEKARSLFFQINKKQKPDYKLVINNDYIKGAIEYLDNNDPSIISVVKSNKNFLEKLFFGSLSEKMIYHSKVPLLVIPNNLDI